MGRTVQVDFKSRFDATNLSSFVKEVSKQLENISLSDAIKKDLSQNLGDIEKILSKVTNFNFKNKDVSGFSGLVKELEGQVTQIQGKISKLNHQDFDFKVNSKELDDASSKILKFEKELERMKQISQSSFSDVLGASNLSRGLKQSMTDIDGLKNKISEMKQEFSTISLESVAPPKSFERYKVFLEDLEATKKKIEETQKIIDKNNATGAGNKAKTQSAKDAGFNNYTELKNQLSAMQTAVKLEEELQIKLVDKKKKHSDIINELEKINDLLGDQPKSIEASEKELAKMKNEYKQIEETTRQEMFSGQVENIQKMGSACNSTKGDFSELTKETANFEIAVNQAAGKEMSDQIGNFAKRWLGIGLAIQQVNKIAKDAWSTYRELDTQVTGIAMVTGQTLKDTWNEVTGYTELARQLGITTADVAKQSEEFYRQGLNQADTMAMIEGTTMMAAIANMDYGESVNYMTAAINGFKLSGEDAIKVSDIFSKLDAVAATSVEDLAIALSKTASIAKSAGMEIETTSAFLTKMIETTQEAPENLGTAMKSIIARMQELKESPMSLLEDGIDANKVETALKLAGVALRGVNHEFRNLDDVLLELGSQWDTLDRNTQRYIATIVAGNRQQSRFIALMDDHQRTQELVNLAYDSAGTSSVAFQTKLGNLDTAINKIKVSWEAFYLKGGLVEFFTSAANGAASLIQTFADLGLAGTSVAAAIAFIVIKLGVLIVSNALAAASTGALVKTQTLSAAISAAQGTGFLGVAKALLGYAGASFAATGATSALATAGLALQAAFLPLLIITAIVAAIGGIIYVATNGARSVRKFREELQELKAASEELTRESKSVTKLIIDYIELQKAYSGTNEEKEKLAGITNELVNQYPELLAGYDEEGNAILRNTDYLQRFIKLKEVEAAQARYAESAKQLEGYSENKDEEWERIHRTDDGTGSIANFTTKQDELYGITRPTNAKSTNGLNSVSYTEGAFTEQGLQTLFEEYQLTSPDEFETIEDLREAATGAWADAIWNELGAKGQRLRNELYEASADEIAQIEEDLGTMDAQYEQVLKNRDYAQTGYITNAARDVSSILYNDAVTGGEIVSEAKQEAARDLAGAYYEAEWLSLIDSGASDDDIQAFIDKFDPENYASLAVEIRNNFNEAVTAMSDEEAIAMSALLNNEGGLNYNQYKGAISGYDGAIREVLDGRLEAIKKEWHSHLNQLDELLGGEGSYAELVGKQEGVYNAVYDNTNFVMSLVPQLSQIDSPENRAIVAEGLSSLMQSASDIAKKGNVDIGAVESIIGNIDPTDMESIIRAKYEISELIGLPVDSETISEMFRNIGIEAEFLSKGAEYTLDRVQAIINTRADFADWQEKSLEGALSSEDVKNMMFHVPELELGDFEYDHITQGFRLITGDVRTFEAAWIETQSTVNQGIISEAQITQQQILSQAGFDNIEMVRERIAVLEESGTANEEEVASLKEVEVAYTDLQLSIDETIMKEQALASSLSGQSLFAGAVDEVNAYVVQMGKITNAMEEQNEHGQISLSTMAELIAMDAQYAAAIEIVNGNIQLNTDLLAENGLALENNAKASIQASINSLVGENAKMQARINSLKAMHEIIVSGEKITAEQVETILLEEASVLEQIEQFKIDTVTESETAQGSAVAQGAQYVASVQLQDVANTESWAMSLISANNSIIESYNELTKARSGVEANANTSLNMTKGAIGIDVGDITIDPTQLSKNSAEIAQQINGSIEKNGSQAVADYYQGQIDALEQTYNENSALIENMQGLMGADWNEAFAKTGDGLEKAGEGAGKAKKEVDELAQALDNLHKNLDTFQGALETLNKGVDEWNANGHISVDTYQEILKLGPGYLQYLTDSNGKLELNEESMHRLIAAQVESLAIEQARQLVEKAGIAIREGDAAALHALAFASAGAATSTWDLVYAQLAALGLSDDMYKSMKSQIDNIKKLSEAAIRGIGKETITGEESEKRRKKAIEDRKKAEEKARKEAEQAAKEAEDREKKRLQLIDKMENALLKALMARDQKEIDRLKDKYDKMKALDIDYINALKKMREKEKRMKEEEKDMNDLTKMKNRLALLERDNSGIYAKEIIALTEEIRQKEEELSEKKKDQIISDLEEEVKEAHAAYDKELKALEDANKAKKENMAAYWAEVQAIMDKGVDAMIATLMEYDESFQGMSDRQKNAWIEEMTEAANAVMGIMKEIEDYMNNLDFDIDVGGADTDFNDPGTGKPTTKPSGGGGSSKPSGGGNKNSGTKNFSGRIYATSADAKAGKNGMNPTYGSGPYTVLSNSNGVAKVRYHKLSSGVTGWFPSSKAYKTGGLVDYTGPAWVDGTKSKPEAFLSGDDTAMVRNFLDALKNPKISLGDQYGTPTPKINTPDTVGNLGGTTTVEIEIRVDKIGSDYDVDQMLDRVEERFIQATGKRTTVSIRR